MNYLFLLRRLLRYAVGTARHDALLRQRHKQQPQAFTISATQAKGSFLAERARREELRKMNAVDKA